MRRLRIIRRGLGRKIDLRLDANEAWSPAEVAERIRVLEPFGIKELVRTGRVAIAHAALRKRRSVVGSKPGRHRAVTSSPSKFRS